MTNRSPWVRLTRTALAGAALGLSAAASAQITLYEWPDFGGRQFTEASSVGHLDRYEFNDRASSAVITGSRWQLCEHAAFAGRCVVLAPGRYPTLASMGLNNQLSSARSVSWRDRVEPERPPPPPPPISVYRRRADERLFEADVSSVRAVVGPPERRCWVERAEVQDDGSSQQAAGTVAGALIGGILGHQLGSAGSRQLTTVGGAVAGAVIGSELATDRNSPSATQSVRRCTVSAGSARPDYWDVVYVFRGQTHRMQTARPPGPTVTVNRLGEPRT